MLILVAVVAVNIWLFRFGPIWGIVGLSVTKHIVIAQLCHALGVDKKRDGDHTASRPPLIESAERSEAQAPRPPDVSRKTATTPV